MTDETPGTSGPAENGAATATAVTQAEIDAIVDDPALSAAEKQVRLEELRERILAREHAAHDEDHMPFETRIMDALSMLAEGGHDYGAAGPVAFEKDERPV